MAINHTLPLAPSQSDVKEGSELTWINREARPILAKLHEITGEPYQAAVEGQTTDATPLTIWTSDALPTNASWFVQTEVVANKPDGNSESAGYVRRALFTDNAGTVAQVGATTSSTVETSAGMDAALSVSGRTVILQVTGLAGTTLNWVACLRIWRSRQQ